MAYVRGLVVLCVLLISVAPQAFAHGGGVNAEGCHNNRKTGNYHCHAPKRAKANRQLERAKLSPQPAPLRNGEVYFRRCADAHAAGRSNMKRGDPGYRPALDRDRDGIACERN